MMSVTKRFLSLLGILCFMCGAFAASSYAATITAGGSGCTGNTCCTAANVQAAINIASDGDTVYIPSGTCTWSSTVAMNKAIRLTGAGTGVTVINNGITTDYIPILSSAYSSGDRRIDNFTMVGRAVSGSHNIGVAGNGRIRIDHMVASSMSTWILIAHGASANYGVIDNNVITVGHAYAEAISITGVNNNAALWAAPDDEGTSKAWYIENNTFRSTATGDVGGHAVTGTIGARYVVRNNDIEDMTIDAHGLCASEGGSTRHYEIYDNTFRVNSGKTMYYWMHIRGASGIIFNNSMTVAGTLGVHKVSLAEQQLCHSYCPCYTGEYPAPYQIGRGYGQALVPLYMWGNTVNGAPVTDAQIVVSGTDCGKSPNDFIQSGRDYFVSASTAKPGFTPYTYPHPLRQRKGFLDTGPASPIGLRITSQ